VGKLTKDEKRLKHRKFKGKPKIALLHDKISLVKETKLLQNAEKLYMTAQNALITRINNPRNVSIPNLIIYRPTRTSNS
jgi:hypothetical protein